MSCSDGRNSTKPKNHDPLDGDPDRPRKVVIWFGHNLRLAKVFEKTIESAEAWLLIASIQLPTRAELQELEFREFISSRTLKVSEEVNIPVNLQLTNS